MRSRFVKQSKKKEKQKKMWKAKGREKEETEKSKLYRVINFSNYECKLVFRDYRNATAIKYLSAQSGNL